MTRSANHPYVANKDNYSESLYPYASCFHMTYEAFLTGGKWLYQNGQLTKLCENTPGDETVRDLNEMDSLKACYQEALACGSIQIDGTIHACPQDGLWVVLYDELKRKTLFSRTLY